MKTFLVLLAAQAPGNLHDPSQPFRLLWQGAAILTAALAGVWVVKRSRQARSEAAPQEPPAESGPP